MCVYIYIYVCECEYISDINYEITDSTVSWFADDTRIIVGIKDEEDTQML